MALVATALTVTPLSDGTKRMTITGSVAAYEKVAVTVVGVNDVTDPLVPVLPAGLVLRLSSHCGRVEYARFPAGTGDVWVADGANATCTLDLNTAAIAQLFRCAAQNDTREADVLLESGTADNLYGVARLLIRNWVQNPLDPVAGSLQMQAQIDTLTERIEEHQHDDEVEGEASFPHNNLSGRDVAGVHPTIEAGVAGAALAAHNAQATADTASLNASQAQATADAAVAVTSLIQDGLEFSQVTGASTLGQVKSLLNQIVAVLNTWRQT